MAKPSRPVRLALRLILAAAGFAAGTAVLVGLGIGFLVLGSDPFFWGALGLVIFALPALLLALTFLALCLHHRVPREAT